MTIHAFTSFTFSYLNRARVLAATLRKQHPEWVIWAVLTDREPPGFRFDPGSSGFDRLVTVEDLFGAETDAWLFGLDIVEACTAVKGRALNRILAEPGASGVMYFDPDIAVLNPLSPVTDLLESHAIVLTPHQVDPDPPEHRESILANEISSLAHGVFNLGFLAVNASDEARRFAGWWEARLRDWCIDRKDLGLFVDQKWCDLVPCLFDDVKVLRDPGYNVASWNLGQRRMTFDAEGMARVNGVPLRFYHFTKLGAVGDRATRRAAGDNAEVHELWWWYRREVDRQTEPAIPQRWWHYGVFDNGVPIEKWVRELYRSRDDLRREYPAPRSTGPGSLFAWLDLDARPS
jgi:hypothetical protein